MMKKLPQRVNRTRIPKHDFKLRNALFKAFLLSFIFVLPLTSYSQDKNTMKAKTDALAAQKGVNKAEPNTARAAAADQSLRILSTPAAQVQDTKHKPIAQTDERCGATTIEAMIKEQYPNRKSTEQFEQWMRNSNNSLLRQASSVFAVGGTVCTIPVVVHVIDGPISVSDAQVQSQIDVLNEDFRRMNADAANTPADFLGVAADVEIEFALATVDPDGNPTNGINRYDGGQTSYSIADMESSVKPATIWHPDFYFNIWCAPLQGGLLGYAQFPSSSTLPGFDDDEGPSYTDGIVSRDFTFGSGGSAQAPFNLGRTTTHEAGHFFGLRHNGGDGGCGADDFCADTPTQNGQNNNTEDDCSYPADNDCDDGPGDLPDQFMNYMDYSDDACMNLFTQDQKARMEVVMSLSPRRASLAESQVHLGVPPDYPYDPFADAPANDLCAGAELIECGDVVDGTTTGSSARDIPPACGSGPDGAGVWYNFVGDGSDVTVGLCGSAFDTKLNVYSGTCDALACEGGNDDSCGLQSEVSLTTVNGETYWVYVNGFSGGTGDFTLTLTCDSEPPPPPSDVENDFCEDAIAVGCGETVEGTTTGAVQDLSGTCVTSIAAPGVWYSFTGTGEFVTASTCNQADFDTKIIVIEAVDCDSDLFCVTGNDDGPGCSGFTSEAIFFGEEGINYFIYVSGFSGATGDFSLSIECIPPPENDLCEGAIPLSCDSSVTGDTTFASTTGAPATDCSGSSLGQGIWYTIEGTGGDINLSTCDTADFDTKIDVFTGSCDELVCEAGNDDGVGCSGFTSDLTFASELGETYYVYVSGFVGFFGTSTGQFTLNVDCVCIAEAGECATVYNGYEPASCTDLTASMMYGVAPYDYQWSNGDSGETITVCPTETTTYTVTITDAEGCVATDDVTVEVVDVSCGKNGNKVQVCHKNGKTLCVGAPSVAAHLAHGDSLGACGTEVCDPYTGGDGDLAKGSGADWSISPNPAGSNVRLHLENYVGQDVSVQILDFSGAVIKEYKISRLKRSNQNFNVGDIPFGLYFVRLSSEGETSTKTLAVN